MSVPLRDRFDEAYEVTADGCWMWLAGRSQGYGILTLPGGRPELAHRFSYERTVGPIPSGLSLDHLCRTPACVNPAHLEPVTKRVNSLRGQSPMIVLWREDKCLRGHSLLDNPILNGVWRRCRVCARAQQRRRNHLQRTAARRARLATEAGARRRNAGYSGSELEQLISLCVDVGLTERPGPRRNRDLAVAA